MKNSFTIYSPARLHIGFLDLDNLSSRQFGSIGLTISNFFFKIKIEKSKRTEINCKNCITRSKIKEVIKLIKKEKKIGNFTINVFQEIPIHNGLGSGTQLALSIGYLISKLFKLNSSVEELAYILKRGLRSGIGIQSFKKGGFNIDVGKLKNSKRMPLSLMNLKWPKDWKILLVLDSNIVGVHGEKEVQEFNQLKVDKPLTSDLNCKSLLMNIIPGIIENNFEEFAKGLRNIQDNMSKIFYGNKKKFASINLEKLFTKIENKEVLSFGQSSWGPTGFIFLKNSKKRNELLKYLERYISVNSIHGLRILKVEGRNFGKKIITKGEE